MKKIKLILCIIILISFPNNAKAIQEKTENYTLEYQQYLQLSDEEKENCEVIPRKYEVEFSSIFGVDDNTMDAQEIEGKLPEKFDLRDKISLRVKNQGSYGLCWSFASLESLETNLALRGYDYDFSELHMDYLESTEFFGMRDLHSGGNFSDFERYSQRIYGPVKETDVPYNAFYSKEQYDELLHKNVDVFVTETVKFPAMYKGEFENHTEAEFAQFRTAVKKHIMENGSLYAVCNDPSTLTTIVGNHYAMYCDEKTMIEETKQEHAISIIGWDDHYSRFNFAYQPEHDGAYIALNSWGENWGENGYFYISYDDALVETAMSGVVQVEFEREKLEKSISFEDENLYEAIKETLSDKILSADDITKTVKLNRFIIPKIESLELSSKGICNLSGLEEFENLNILNLRDNRIDDIAVLKSLKHLQMIDLSQNTTINMIDLSDLTELSTLDLSKNQLQNLENLKLPEGIGLYLDDCGLKENDLEKISTRNYSELSLQNNNLQDIQILQDWEIVFLNLANNAIEDVHDLKKVLALNLSGNKYVKGISELKQLNELWLIDCGLQNLEELLPLENLDYICVDQNDISSIPKEFEEREVMISIQGNHISEINKNLIRRIEAGGQVIERAVEIEIDADYIMALPSLFTVIAKQCEEGQSIEFITENCSFNKEKQEITIHPTELQSGTAKVLVQGDNIIAESELVVHYRVLSKSEESKVEKDENEDKEKDKIDKEDENKITDTKTEDKTTIVPSVQENNHFEKQTSKNNPVREVKSESVDNTISKTMLPRTGLERATSIVVILLLGNVAYCLRRYRKMNKK